MSRADASPGRRPHARRWAGVLAALTVAAGALLLSAPAASAHADLLEATPADGEVLQAAPDMVVLTFNDVLATYGLGLQVLDADGKSVGATSPTASGRELRAQLPSSLPDGAYTVQWRVVSADGHPVSGEYAFGVVGPGASQQARDQVVERVTAPPPGGSSGSAWVIVFGIALMAVMVALLTVTRLRAGSREDPP
jgi:methionine-rich copper-binding protein CopC